MTMFLSRRENTYNKPIWIYYRCPEIRRGKNMQKYNLGLVTVLLTGPPKLRHILGGLASSEKISVKKETLPRSNHFLKIQWEINLLTFWNTDGTSSKKKFRIEICTFSFEICFWNQFLTSGSGQTENTQIRIFTYFQSDHFLKSKIDSESRFEMRMYIFLL